MSRKSWRWKAGDQATSERLDLLYEPGNWGDVLKGTWALHVVSALGTRPLRFVDPFAGAATYALTESASRRLARIGTEPAGLFARAQSSFVARRRLASTGRLVLGASPAGSTARVFDVDAARRASWDEVPGATVAVARDGEDLLTETSPKEADLVLVDPYDLVERWRGLSTRATVLAQSALVLLYAYSKAPRGGGHARAYRSFRCRLEEELRGEPALMAISGRLPSDERQPRAYHEVVLLGPRETLVGLVDPLRELTLPLARLLAEEGAFDVVPASPDR